MTASKALASSSSPSSIGAMILSPAPLRRTKLHNKKVHFRVRNFEYYEPGLEQEINLDRTEELWYSTADFYRFEFENQATITRMLKSKNFLANPTRLEKNLLLKRNMSMRGLETKALSSLMALQTSSFCGIEQQQQQQQLQRQQRKSVKVVVALHKTLIMIDDDDDDNAPAGRKDLIVRKTYRKYSSTSVKQAHKKGLQDEMFAEWISDGCPTMISQTTRQEGGVQPDLLEQDNQETRSDPAFSSSSEETDDDTLLIETKTTTMPIEKTAPPNFNFWNMILGQFSSTTVSIINNKSPAAA